jgi:integral membrane protein
VKGFITVGRLEGVSFLVLLLIAMPLKYVAGMPEAVRLVGSAHGGLFVLYVAWSLFLTQKLKWGMDKFVISLILASVPFGTFYFEKKYLKS